MLKKFFSALKMLLERSNISNMVYLPKAASRAFSLRASLCSSVSPTLLAMRQSVEKLSEKSLN